MTYVRASHLPELSCTQVIMFYIIQKIIGRILKGNEIIISHDMHTFRMMQFCVYNDQVLK
jgi:hypothetical protein